MFRRKTVQEKKRGPTSKEKLNPVDFGPNSKLIVPPGARNQKEGDKANLVYKLENNRLVLIRSIPG